MTTKFYSEYKHQPIAGLGSKAITTLSNSIYKKGMYWDVNRTYDKFPKITGFPDLIYEESRAYFINKQGMSIPKLKKAPRKCKFEKIINYDYARFGAPMVKIVAAKGEGKSVLLNLIMALHAAKGVRMLTLNDARMEIRSLAAHGWIDKENVFHPFEIDIFRPKGYQYKRADNPLWKYYPNVHDREFTTSDDIIQSMEPKKFTVVYEDCFTRSSLLKLLNDLVEQLVEEFSREKIYTVAHHEVARLIPENPTKDINKIVRRWSDNFSNFRKDKIGFDGCFHDSSYSFYQTIQRIGNLIQKAPVDKKRYSKIEKDALVYTRENFAIKRGGRGWMKHTIGLFPELPDEFRLVAQRRKLLYPSLEYEDVEDEQENNLKESMMEELDDKDSIILNLVMQGYKSKDIAPHVGLHRRTVDDRIKKIRDLMKKSYKVADAVYT